MFSTYLHVHVASVDLHMTELLMFTNRLTLIDHVMFLPVTKLYNSTYMYMDTYINKYIHIHINYIYIHTSEEKQKQYIPAKFSERKEVKSWKRLQFQL